MVGASDRAVEGCAHTDRPASGNSGFSFPPKKPSLLLCYERTPLLKPAPQILTVDRSCSQSSNPVAFNFL